MDYTIKSLVKGLQIIEVLAGNPTTAKEITEKLKINKSTLHRFLATLESQQYIQQAATGEYSLTQKFMQLALTAQHHTNLAQIAAPYLMQTAQKFGESCLLAYFDNYEVFYAEKVESPHAVRIVIEPGRRARCHSVASGKVFLAHMKQQDIEHYLTTPLQAFTENTIVTKERLVEELDKVRSQGYAVDYEEYEIGLRGIAVPIRNYTGEVIAALCVAGVSLRLQEERIEGISSYLCEAGKSISEKLGLTT